MAYYLQEAMFQEFKTTDCRFLSYFLGIEAYQQPDGIFVSQKKYAKKIMEKFKMSSCDIVNTLVAMGLKLSKEGDGKSVDTTQDKIIVGILRYLTITRLHIVHAVVLVSRLMEM